MIRPHPVAPGGPTPKFTDYHIWKALMVMNETKPIGRKSLSAALNLGEGSTRTILDMFCEEGYVTVTKSGAVLSDKGRRAKDLIKMDVGMISVNDLTIGAVNCAVKIRGVSKKVTYGCEERDAAIKAGATGATTLVCVGNKMIFPGSEYPVTPQMENALKKEFRIGNGDVIIIGTAPDAEKAEKGAVSAAIRLLGGIKLSRSAADMPFQRNSTKELISFAFMIHDLVGRLPVCARSRDDLGIRIERGTVIDNTYTGDVLEEALELGTTVRRVATSGPYKGIKVIVAPLEMDGEIVAAVGVVDIRAMEGVDNLIRMSDEDE
jgi:predicted transcriptional regulator